jgi:hypothetical protein
MTKKQNKLHVLKSLAHYGVHIWAILIIANATLAYAFHYSTQANESTRTLQDATEPEEEKESEEESAQTPNEAAKKSSKPLGATITLAFQIPGIGSGSANMTPVRLERNLTLYLYAPDANSLNNTVKPLYTIKTKVAYDTNTLSPTYTSYIVKDLDLGGDVKNGNYQLAFRTNESLRTLIKESPDNVGGQLFDLKNTTRLKKIPPQKVLMGDTLPIEGDNVVDISDYNAFVNCFGERSSTDFCTGNNYGDFDDNGTIDGVDYNLLLRSFGELLKQGQSIPKITQAPTGPARVSRLSNLTTPTQAEKKPSPAKAAAKPASSGSAGNVLGGILFFIFILIAGAVAFILYKKNEKFRTLVKAILHRSPTGTPPPPADPNAPVGAAEADPANATSAETPPVESTAAAVPPPVASAEDPNGIATSTEMPVGQQNETPASQPDAAAVAASTEIPVTAAAAPTPVNNAPAAGESVEKDCYVKKKLPGDATGIWLTLTDDNGALDAHYNNPEVQEGFAKVKGVMKTENGKTFLEISEIIGEG